MGDPADGVAVPARGERRTVGDPPRRAHDLFLEAVIVDDTGDEVFRLRFERR